MATGLLESIDRSTQLAGHNRLALLLFRLDERQIFGINVFKVQEVLPCPRISWMPSAHPLVKGVADIRGRVVPVIDLRKAVGGEPTPDDSAAHVIVTEFNRSVQGFLVRAVDRIIHVNVETVLPPPNGGQESYLTAITRFGQWWKRAVRSGHAFAEGAWLHGAPPERHWVRETRRIWLWGLVLPLIIGLAMLALGAWAALLWLVYPLQWLRLSMRSGSARSSAYMLIGKFAEVSGAIKFHVSRWRGVSGPLIEYK